jgi:hypothetical protein
VCIFAGKKFKKERKKEEHKVKFYKNAEREEKKVKKDLGEEGIIYRGFGDIVPYLPVYSGTPPPPRRERVGGRYRLMCLGKKWKRI